MDPKANLLMLGDDEFAERVDGLTDDVRSILMALRGDALALDKLVGLRARLIALEEDLAKMIAAAWHVQGEVDAVAAVLVPKAEPVPVG